jgi:hypothetical protein
MHARNGKLIQEFSRKNLKEKEHSVNLGVEKRAILKWIGISWLVMGSSGEVL